VIKRVLSLLICIIFIFGTSYTAFADDNPQDAIVKSKIKFQQMDDSILETNKKISALNIQIDKLNTDINKNKKDIADNNKLIDTEKAHVEQLTKEYNSRKDLANRRLRAMYINGYSENFLVLLLTADNFSDLYSKFEAITRIISFDKKLFDDLSAKRNVLDESISSLDAKNQKLQQLKKSNEEDLSQLADGKNKLQDLIKQFNKEKASAAQIIKENEEKLIAHAVLVIDSQAFAVNDVRNALQTLNSLLPQLSTDSVKQKAKNYINSGNKKLLKLMAESATPSRGSTETYKATYSMEATAYTGGGLTALGLRPVRDPADLSTIAVDPDVIPLGSKVFIPGYGYAIASDTGGAIKGYIIDLYMNSEEECYQWGRRPVTLYIVANPGEW
jgi:3D (Asp-Asp-Asp) domain-containing protein/peptidoglycan hydrolase CwlO-like protein